MGMENMLKEFSPINLEEMGSVRLLNRVDTKFVTTVPMLHLFLSMASNDYLVQDIGGRRNMSYYTCYYDTPDCAMFHEHIRGKKARQKIRMRIYEDSETAFLEVKTKNNKGRTNKKRTPATIGSELAKYADFIEKYSLYCPNNLVSQVENHFSRITLVNNAKTERLTIDTGLWFHNVATNAVCTLDGLVIVELKRNGNVASPVLEMLRRLHIHPDGFSKYCVGMALTNRTLRQNRLKPKLRQTERLCHTVICNTLIKY